MKKLLMILVFISCISSGIHAQTYSSEMYSNIKEYYALKGIKIETTSQKEIKEKIEIVELVKDLNSSQVSMYTFCLDGCEAQFDIIIVEKDSVELYEILAINSILSRVLDLSKKYSDISNNRKDIKWIDEILKLHLMALNQSIFNCCVVEVKRGLYTYNLMLGSLKKNEP